MSANRRGSGEGSIYRRASDKRWVTTVELGYVGGKRMRKVLYGRTRKEVTEKLKQLHRAQHEGVLRATDKTTVKTYLLDWLDLAHVRRLGSTVAHYRYLIETYIIVRIGHIRLEKLASDDIAALVAAIVAEGHVETARQCRQILNRACKDAVKRRPPLLAINPVAGTDPPVATEPGRQPRALNDTEARLLLLIAASERFGIAILLGLLLGLRRGEICGLKWSDVDWEAKTIAIQRTAKRVGKERTTNPPKNKKPRVLPLIDAVIAALRSHQAAQAEEFALKGLENAGNLIVASQSATQYDTANYLRAFRAILTKAGLPAKDIRPHDLRHSTASLLIGFGVDPRTVSNILGHATTALTMDIYTRGQQTDRRGALEELAQRLRQPIKAVEE